jgi:hypothetical protein
MRKLAVNVLLAGAIAGALPLAWAEDGQTSDASADATTVDVAPTAELPVSETPVDEVGPTEELPAELVDPPQDTVVDTGETEVTDPAGDGVVADDQIVTLVPGDEGDAGGAKDDEVIEVVPVDENVIMPPENPEDGMMYITGAPVGIEATSGLADGPVAATEPRMGLDDAAAGDALPADFPAPMDVLEAEPGGRNRAVPATPR